MKRAKITVMSCEYTRDCPYYDCHHRGLHAKNKWCTYGPCALYPEEGAKCNIDWQESDEIPVEW